MTDPAAGSGGESDAGPPPEATIQEAEPGPRDFRSLLAEPAAVALLSALVAWSVTVAPAAFARGAPASAKIVAIAAFFAGCAGPLIRQTRRRLARHVGVSLFLALSVIAWLLTPAAIAPGRLDPIRGAIGAVAWGAFALSQRDGFRRPGEPRTDPGAPTLAARGQLPTLAVPVAIVGVASSLVVLVLAWHVRDPDRALLSHVVATGAAIALLGASAVVATSRGKRSSGGRRMTPAIVRPLVLLAVTAVVGAVALAIR